MSAAATEDTDQFVPSVGFVIAGLGLATGFLPWTDAVAYGPVESIPGVVAGLIALVAFGARRYGRTETWWSGLAAVGTASLVWTATVAFLYPVAVTGTEVSAGAGLPLAFVLGVIGVGIAYADYLGLNRQSFLSRSRVASSALAIGILGLLVGFLFSALLTTLVPGLGPVGRSGVGTVGFSIGLGVVAIGFLTATDYDLTFIDVEWLDRRDWAYVIGGVVAMYAVLFGLAAFFNALGLPSAQHGLIDQARDDPALLLAFIPLSLLAIGPGEELLNRNIVQKYLYDAFSRPSAILIATLIFTVIHIPAYSTAGAAAVFTTLLRLFGISLVLGIVYERTENVIVAALVHGAYNAIQFALAYVALTRGFI